MNPELIPNPVSLLLVMLLVSLGVSCLMATGWWILWGSKRQTPFRFWKPHPDARLPEPKNFPPMPQVKEMVHHELDAQLWLINQLLQSVANQYFIMPSRGTMSTVEWLRVILSKLGVVDNGEMVYTKVQAEAAILESKLSKLVAFLNSPAANEITPSHLALLDRQKNAMVHYLSALQERIELLDREGPE